MKESDGVNPLSRLGTSTIIIGDFPAGKVVTHTPASGKPIVKHVWVHEKEGVLKMEMPQGGAHGGPLTMSVSRLSVEHKLGDKTLQCREFTLKTRTSTGTTLYAMDVPGLLVRTETVLEMGTMKNKSLMELVSFEKKP